MRPTGTEHGYHKLLPGRPSRVRLLLICMLSLGIFAGHLAAQSDQLSTNPVPSAPTTGSIGGTIVDKDNLVVPNVTVALTSGAFTAQIRSDADGGYNFASVPPGSFDLVFSAPGFASQKQSGVLDAGQSFAVPQIQLVVATNIEVDVTQTREEIATEQIHVEETQRIFGVIPNFFVTYDPDPVPLNSRQKFQLGWKSVIDPVSFGIAGVFAGIEQATDAHSGYGQGAQGYAKRFGATYADYVSGTLIGSSIFPSIFKQDPRYFYKGTGTKKSRFFYAVAAAVICKGDNGHWQPNYSNMLGALAAGGLSNLYYPASDRSGVGLTFENAAIGIGGSAMGAVVEEFFLHKVTSHSHDRQQSQN